MARSTANEVSAREIAFASGRRLTIAAALIIVLSWIASPDRASAQFGPPGPVEQPPFSSFSPFPPSPPPAQLAPPPAQPAERANEERRVARPYRARRKAVERRPQPLVAKKEAVANRKEGRRRSAAGNENQRRIAESKGYKAVSDLVNFPKFFPGLGKIYVRPDTLPTGPYLCFDRRDRLVATVYMISIKDIDDHKAVDASGLTSPSGFNAPVDHVSFYFNAGHPGMDMPHYHFVIWHVSKKDEARVAQ
jgi:hypothetical protein